MSKTQILLDAIKEGMIEKKAQNITSIDFIGHVNAITDYFLICEMTTDKQVKAVAESIEKSVFEKTKEKPIHKEGYENFEWVILDYFDVVVHIFQSEFREAYKLEDLWGDASIQKFEVNYSSIDH